LFSFQIKAQSLSSYKKMNRRAKRESIKRYRRGEKDVKELLGDDYESIPFKEIPGAIELAVPILEPILKIGVTAIGHIASLLDKIVPHIPFGFINVILSSCEKGWKQGPKAGLEHLFKETTSYIAGSTAGGIAGLVAGAIAGVVFTAATGGHGIAAVPFISVVVKQIVSWCVSKGVSCLTSHALDKVSLFSPPALADSPSATKSTTPTHLPPLSWQKTAATPHAAQDFSPCKRQHFPTSTTSHVTPYRASASNHRQLSYSRHTTTTCCCFRL
jgi:hypothetical protein